MGLTRWGFILLAAVVVVLTEALVLVTATPALWIPLAAIGILLGWWALRDDAA
jgi:hypothetical protein